MRRGYGRCYEPNWKYTTSRGGRGQRVDANRVDLKQLCMKHCSCCIDQTETNKLYRSAVYSLRRNTVLGSLLKNPGRLDHPGISGANEVRGWCGRCCESLWEATLVNLWVAFCSLIGCYLITLSYFPNACIVSGIGKTSYLCQQETLCASPYRTKQHSQTFRQIQFQHLSEDISADQRRKLDKFITLFNHGIILRSANLMKVPMFTMTQVFGQRCPKRSSKVDLQATHWSESKRLKSFFLFFCFDHALQTEENEGLPWTDEDDKKLLELVKHAA